MESALAPCPTHTQAEGVGEELGTRIDLLEKATLQQPSGSQLCQCGVENLGGVQAEGLPEVPPVGTGLSPSCPTCDPAPR